MVFKLFTFSWILFVFALKSQTGNTIVDSIYSGGKYRSYRLYIPANYTGNNAVPLILNLHGYTSNALQQQLYSNFMPIADTAGFLMVYPQGVSDMSGNPFWNAGTVSTSFVNDTLFLNQLIDSLKLLYNIDSGRVFMTGLSNGAFMSHYMACFCNRKIKAIASVAGTWFNFWPTCSPGKVVPVMHIHGTADPTVPYYGNSSMLSADSTVKRWVNKNYCIPVASYSAVPDINTSDGSTADHYRYFISGNPKSIVEFYKINGGAHTWPGSPYIIGTTNQDINASAEIWRFFRQFNANDFSTKVELMTVQTNTLLMYPQPVSDKLYLECNDLIQDIKIQSISGQCIKEYHFDHPTKSIIVDLNFLNSGIYFVILNNQRAQKLIKVEN